MTNNTIEIYGTTVVLPTQPPLEHIDGYNLPKEDQLWRRKDLPEFFETVEYNKEGDLILTEQQEAYAREEVRRCKEGHWIMINGAPIFIPPKYYFYLQWWKLEDDIYPHYRNADRRYFLFLQHWEKVQWNIGVIRAKRRREGATSQATSNLIYECIFYKNSKCGLVSKTKEDSKAAFTDMVSFGYKQLPVFLKPKQVNKEDSVTELVFAHKSQSNRGATVSAIKDDSGHQSRVNYRAPVLNAYDSGRVSRLLLDEGGKYPKETPVSQLLAIVSKTLVKGVKRVGYLEAPSTTNSLSKGTGTEFKKIWDKANQFKAKPTVNRLVRYFTPAFDGYDGFVDKYGQSVIGEPTPEQYEYLVAMWVRRDEETGELVSELSEEDIKLGARHYVEVTRRKDLEGELLEEEIRMNPCNEDEAFFSTVSDCAFDAIKINRRLKELDETPVPKRKLLFYRDLDGVVKTTPAADTSTFHWELTQLPPSGKENRFDYYEGKKRPLRTQDGVLSVDGYSNSQGGRKYGSKASAWLFRRFDVTDPQHSGKFVGHLYGRPKEKDDLHQQVMLAAEYFGYKVYYEFNSDDYLSYFRRHGHILYLAKFPLSAIDPEKRAKAERFYGFPTTPFSLTKQLDTMVAYVLHYCDRIDFEILLNNMLPFDPYDRTSYDAVVSAMIALVASLEAETAPPPPPKPIVKVYPNVAVGAN